MVDNKINMYFAVLSFVLFINLLCVSSAYTTPQNNPTKLPQFVAPQKSMIIDPLDNIYKRLDNANKLTANWDLRNFGFYNGGNSIFTGNLTAPNICYSDGSNCIVSGNLSWNQSLADTLYSNIIWGYNMSSPFYTWLSGFVYNYNQTEPANSYTNTQISNNNASWLSTYNITYQNKADYQVGTNSFNGSGDFNTTTGIVSAKTFISNGLTDNSVLWTFNTDRPWSFKTRGTGAATVLGLSSSGSNKMFKIQNDLGGTIWTSAEFSAQNTAGADPVLKIIPRTDSSTSNLNNGLFIDQNGNFTSLYIDSESNLSGIKIDMINSNYVAIQANGQLNATGNINTARNFSVNDQQGLTIGVTVMKTAITTCDLNYTGGILTSTTC